MQSLKTQLLKKLNDSPHKNELLNKLEQGNIEYIFVTLMHDGLLNYDEYKKLKLNYEKRNKNLDIIRITSPRTFGESWAENHVVEVVPILKSTKGTEAKGKYDVFYKNEKNVVKIEVKAGRAIDRTLHHMPYHERALISTDKNGLFDMNFQQMKPTCFDVIIMIGVWADKIRYWFMTSEEIKKHKHFSVGQHRGNKGYEGQIHVKTENIDDFKKFEVTPKEIATKVAKLARK